MRPYRDTVTRVSIRQLRAQFSPKVFAALDEVVVQAGAGVAKVKIVSVPSSAHGGRRRWILCPRCSRQTSVIGLMPDVVGADGWGCFRCRRWKSRKPCNDLRSTR